MELMTVNEFSNKYKIHPKTAYKLAREGKLEVVRVGRSVRFVEPKERMVRNASK